MIITQSYTPVQSQYMPDPVTERYIENKVCSRERTKSKAAKGEWN